MPLTPTPLSSLKLTTLHVPSHPTSPGTLPLLVYHSVFPPSTPPAQIESHLKSNGFDPQWRYGIYPFSHYHTTTHEILAVFRGKAHCLVGGEKNPEAKEVVLEAGDLVIMPVGMAHKALSTEGGFQVVGAYPRGCAWDEVRGEKHGVEEALQKVKALESDPVYGEKGPAVDILGA